jgi:hypothetical protein
MGMMDNLRSRIVDWLTGGVSKGYEERVDFVMDRREYRMGIQRRFIKTRVGQANDNLVINYTGLFVDRGVSMLFGKDVLFEFGEREDAQNLIDEIWKYNKKSVLLLRLALMGAEAGHCFLKFVSQEDGKIKLVAIDPSFVDIESDPDDFERIIQYTIQYKTFDEDGNEAGRKEITKLEDTGWMVRNYEADKSGEWMLVKETAWDYDFPPILDWQNLPNVGDAWGMPDITKDTIELQDRINFIASNMSKIIRLYAHPKTWGRDLGATSRLEMGPDDIVNLGANGELGQLPPVADMIGSKDFLLSLRQSLFDITRTVDISSMADKLGALTNFGLHVLYQDALSKLETKRGLYGDALVEANRRLLVLCGVEETPCKIIWEDPLPVNEQEQSQVIQSDLNAGIVDKETASELRGYDWEIVSERLGDQQQNSADLGAGLLAAFDRNAMNANAPNEKVQQKVV